jgi:hypothetical protein
VPGGGAGFLIRGLFDSPCQGTRTTSTRSSLKGPRGPGRREVGPRPLSVRVPHPALVSPPNKLLAQTTRRRAQTFLKIRRDHDRERGNRRPIAPRTGCELPGFCSRGPGERLEPLEAAGRLHGLTRRRAVLKNTDISFARAVGKTRDRMTNTATKKSARSRQPFLSHRSNSCRTTRIDFILLSGRFLRRSHRFRVERLDVEWRDNLR